MENITWLPVLYQFDNEGSARRWQIGYQEDKVYTRSGKVYLKNGSQGKFEPRKPKTMKPNRDYPTGAAHAKSYCQQEWDACIRKEPYHPHPEAPPVDMAKEQWLQLKGDNRRWPAVCMEWGKACGENMPADNDHPWIAQPKINGDRCTIWVKNKKIYMYARSCMERKFMDHIREQAYGIMQLIGAMTNKKVLPDSEFGLDGEIWVPKEAHHQGSRSVVSRTVNQHEDEKYAVFSWFDIMDFTMTTEDRFATMNTVRDLIYDDYGRNHSEGNLSDPSSIVIGNKLPNIHIVPHRKVCSLDAINEYQQYAFDMGFTEGIVLRRSSLMYPKDKCEWKHSDMLKKKKSEDAEFEVIGHDRVNGGDCDGSVVWRLKDPNNENVVFNCSQMGEVDYRRNLHENAEKMYGKLVTVVFDARSKDGVPIMPRCPRFRPDWDLATKHE